MRIKGKRVYPNEADQLPLREGEYGKAINGYWYARPPGFHAGDLSNHEVTEHDDKTITVTPSILLDDGREQWHGHLKKGIWTTC